MAKTRGSKRSAKPSTKSRRRGRRRDARSNVAHLVGAPLGDSSLNPARSIGPAIFQGGDAMEVLWVFILAPIVGGILGLGLFRIIHAER